jgi:hypothetical protein
VTDDGKLTRGAKERAERERRWADIERLEPFIDLAREIQFEVERVAADDSADSASLTEAIERIPRQERERVARAVFDQLAPDVQWSVLERVFGSDEIREYLAAEHTVRVAELQRTAARSAIADSARATNRLDTATVPVDEQITLGLFREADARAAVSRGRTSDACARQLVLRCRQPGAFQVIEDVFNPRGGYFVTRDYDEKTWLSERLPAHAIVRVGAIADTPGGSAFEPELYPGARVDIETDQGRIPGHLHLGFVMLGDLDVFAGRSPA